MNNFIVYKHTSPSGKVYIGITNQKPERRWRAGGSGYRYNLCFYRAIQKYGWENFTHEILYTDLSQEDALRIEKELIQEYQSFKNGYNCSLGGDYGGYVKETKDKISKSISQLWKDEEYRKHMSDAHRGQTPVPYEYTAEIRKKMSDAAKERWKNEEYRKNQISKYKQRPKEFYREKLIKQYADPEQKEKLLAHLKGNHYRAKRVICVETGEIFESTRDAALSIGVARETIGQVCRGKREMTHGCHWRFADE